MRLTAYFKSNALRVHAAMGGKADDGGEDVRPLLRWIRRRALTEFSRRDITQNMRRFRDDEARLDAALEWMTDHHIIRPRGKLGARPKSGRPHTAVYDVSPRFKSSAAIPSKPSKRPSMLGVSERFEGIAARSRDERDRRKWHREQAPEWDGSTCRRSGTGPTWLPSLPSCSMARPSGSGADWLGDVRSTMTTTRACRLTPPSASGNAGPATSGGTPLSW